MLAARWWARGDVRVEDIPEPREPRAGEVLLKMAACGICGTDVEEYMLGPNIVPIEPHPLSGDSAPLILGHEGVGIVESAGPDVGLQPGTRVAIEGNLFCGECWWCQRHEYQLCVKLASLGLMADGVLTEYLVAPSFMCIPFAADVPSERAALSEPLSVAVRAVRRGGVQLGSTVGVIGCGTVGLLTVQAARIAGARKVIAVDRMPGRRELALKLGADDAVGPEEAETAFRDQTDGLGPDVTIEAAGNAKAAAATVKLARKGGTAVLLGVFDDEVPIDMMDLLLGEKTVKASLSHIYDEDYSTAVALIERGEVQIDPLITDRIKLSDVVEKGFKPLVDEPESHLKIVVVA